jgi:hypothetical protein
MVPFRKAERVREVVTDTGSALVVNLGGATLQCRSFVAGLLTPFGEGSPGDQVDTSYVLISGDGTSWEKGRGRVTAGAPSTFSRDTVEFSTNSNARIVLSGTSRIWCYHEALDGFYSTLVVEHEGAGKIELRNYINGVTGSYADIALEGADGTIRSPTYLLTGQRLGGVTFYGWDETDSGWKIGGSMICEAAENWSHSARGTIVRFSINPTGAVGDQWLATYNTHFTITNSGHTATTNVNSTNEAIIGTSLNSSGLKYFEMFCGSSGADFSFGIARPTHLNSDRIGTEASGGAKSVGLKCGVGSNGDWYLNGTMTHSGATSGPNNEWIGLLWDLTSGYALWRKTSAPTVWYGNNSNLGDPSSIATHGFPFTPFSADLAMAFSSNQNGIAESTIMNAGGSAFQAALPSGASAWDSGVDAIGILEMWSDGGMSVGGLTSEGLGTLNFHGFYVDGVPVAVTGSITLDSLSDVTITSAATSDFLAWSGTQWTNRTHMAATALLDVMVGDSGSGGTKGLAPAPGAGDAAAGKYLDAAGGYSVPSGTGTSTLAGATDAAITSPAEDDVLVYTSAKWTNKRPKYVLSPSMSGVLTASQQIMYHRFAKAVTIPANFGSYLGLSSQAGGTANATASTVISVDKAATATPNSFSNVGTITIAAGGVTPTFATSGGAAVTFAAGDVIRIVGPASPDATFAGFYATLVGYET